MIDAFAQMCREVLADAGELSYAWEDRVMQIPHWAQMETETRMNGVVGVFIGIVEAAVCRSSDTQAHQTLLFAAVAHGSQRRAQQKTLAQIGEEYAAVRAVLAPYLERKYGEAARTFRAAIEYAIDEADAASRYGHDHANSSTAWNEYVERLARESLAASRERIGERAARKP